LRLLIEKIIYEKRANRRFGCSQNIVFAHFRLMSELKRSSMKNGQTDVLAVHKMLCLPTFG